MEPASSAPEPLAPGRGSWAANAARRRIMQGNRSQDTLPELRVRRLLHAAGLRFRVNSRPEPSLRVRADVVFTRARIAVFIDGCFWHGCPDHYRLPQRNAGYWLAKIDGNRARDESNTFALESSGWIVLRFWEHEVPDQVAALIAERYRSQIQHLRGL